MTWDEKQIVLSSTFQIEMNFILTSTLMQINAKTFIKNKANKFIRVPILKIVRYR